jgi:hypothetical protein
MEFTKIQLTKQNTLTCVYKNADGDVINFVGANIVHKDLKQAMQALIPHLALITEQREAYDRKLSDLKAQSITDEDSNNVFKKFTVEGISLANDGREVAIQGIRILMKAGVVKLETPRIDTEDSDEYQYTNDLALDVDAVVYEAKAYIEERKWGVKEAEIDFKDIDPFNGVKADEVPMADGEQPKKRGRKSKKAA